MQQPCCRTDGCSDAGEFLCWSEILTEVFGAKECCTSNNTDIVYWEEVFVLYLQFFCKFVSKLCSDNYV